MGVLSEKELDNLIKALSVEEEEEFDYENYVKPQFDELTEEEIEMIHEKGKLTPEEWVKQMEEQYPEVCLFTNGCGRCHTFANCHDCLVEYANSRGELNDFGEKFFNPISQDEMNTFINTYIVDKPKTLKINK